MVAGIGFKLLSSGLFSGRGRCLPRERNLQEEHFRQVCDKSEHYLDHQQQFSWVSENTMFFDYGMFSFLQPFKVLNDKHFLNE